MAAMMRTRYSIAESSLQLIALSHQRFCTIASIRCFFHPAIATSLSHCRVMHHRYRIIAPLPHYNSARRYMAEILPIRRKTQFNQSRYHHRIIAPSFHRPKP